jgi:hypothetical protein
VYVHLINEFPPRNIGKSLEFQVYISVEDVEAGPPVGTLWVAGVAGVAGPAPPTLVSYGKVVTICQVAAPPAGAPTICAVIVGILGR